MCFDSLPQQIKKLQIAKLYQSEKYRLQFCNVHIIHTSNAINTQYNTKKFILNSKIIAHIRLTGSFVERNMIFGWDIIIPK